MRGTGRKEIVRLAPHQQDRWQTRCQVTNDSLHKVPCFFSNITMLSTTNFFMPIQMKLEWIYKNSEALCKLLWCPSSRQGLTLLFSVAQRRGLEQCELCLRTFPWNGWRKHCTVVTILWSCLVSTVLQWLNLSDTSGSYEVSLKSMDPWTREMRTVIPVCFPWPLDFSSLPLQRIFGVLSLLVTAK